MDINVHSWPVKLQLLLARWRHLLLWSPFWLNCHYRLFQIPNVLLQFNRNNKKNSNNNQNKNNDNMFLILIAIRNPNSYPIFAQGPKVNLMPKLIPLGRRASKRKDVYLDPPVVVKEVRMLFHHCCRLINVYVYLGHTVCFFSCALKTWPVLDDGCHLCHQWNAWMILEVETFRYTIIYQNTMNGCGQDALLFLLSCNFFYVACNVCWGQKNFLADVSWVVQSQRTQGWCQHRAATFEAESRIAEREGVLKDALTLGTA